MTSSGRDFTLDRFQLEAIEHLDAGRSVLVAAPTGSGKTVVAEHAIDRALSERKRAFYTAPIKALSNQKYRDLSERIGSSRVGLLTGDNAINADADIVVMTTEVLRNMLYEGRVLDDLGFVIMDEVHYLEDTFRGPVWEEVMLHLPAHAKLVCLSATVSNTDELAGWIESIRGATGCVVERKRPVELTNLYAVGDRRGHRLHVISTLLDGEPNSEGHRFDPDLRRGRRHDRGKREKSPYTTPTRLDVLDHLEDHDLLPVIWFVFSRRGCDAAAEQLERAGARFTDTDEADRIRAIADERLGGLPAADLAVLDTSAWRNRLERGIASHHAGLVPAFKETVEQCFAEGLVRVVFATETLALGVNLPARSVVIDKLTKFTGETHEHLTPAQFTQLTGRAGRRGLDATGHAIVPWSPFVRFEQVAGLAGSESFRLRSAFRPTYNMAANLLQRLDAEAARALLARSFAQYQADTGVARLEQRLARERDRERDLAATVAELPPLDEARVDSPDAISDAVSRLRPGDLVVDDDGLRLAVLGVSWRKGGRARVRLVNESSREVRWRSRSWRRPAHDRPDRSAVPHGSRADRLPTRCRQPDPSVRRRALRTVPASTNASMIPGLRWNAPGTRSRSSNDARRDQASIARRLTRSPTSSAPAAISTAGPSPNQASPCGHLSRGGSPRYRSAHGRSLRRPHGARTRVGCFLLHLRTPQPHATARSVVPFTDRHAALPPTGSAVQSINAAERRGGVDETRSPDPGFAPWPTAGRRGVARRVARSQRRDDRRRLRAQHQAAHRPARATRGERHRSATASAARHAGDAIHRGVVALPVRCRHHECREGADWGERARPPADLIVVDDSAAAVEMLAAERRANRPSRPSGFGVVISYGRSAAPPLGSGLGRGGVARHGRPRCRPRRWRPALVPRPSHRSSIMARGQVLVVANAAFVDDWNIAPRAHPGDGRFDTLETSTMGLGDRWQARSRLKLGTHVPHPAITTRRVEAVQYDFERPMPIWLDGRSIGEARHLSIRLEPDAVDIWI